MDTPKRTRADLMRRETSLSLKITDFKNILIIIITWTVYKQQDHAEFDYHRTDDIVIANAVVKKRL
jgi:hypothetical protein